MYESYKAARNAAWKALIDCEIQTLPVDLTKVAEHYGIAITLYSKCPITQAFAPEVISGDVFITVVGDSKIIFLNDKKGSRERRRFTVAHELGHGILGHPLEVLRYRNSETDDPKNPFEFEANIFARDLLAPAGVLDAIGAYAPADIIRICDISHQSAKIRAQRLLLLRQRDVFGAHPLERKVIFQFKGFITRMIEKGENNL